MKEVTYTKREIITEVAQKLDLYPEDVEKVYTTIIDTIVEHLLECNEKQNVEVRYASGMKFVANFVPRHYHVHPTQDYTLVPDKIKFSFKFSSEFKKQKQKELQQTREMYYKWLENREQYKER